MAKITKDEIKTKLGENRAWAERAIVVLYARQTSEEKSEKITKEHNAVGFSGPDAEILSDYAEWLNSGRNLTPRQLAVAFRLLPKYWKQILTEIEAKAALDEAISTSKGN